MKSKRDDKKLVFKSRRVTGGFNGGKAMFFGDGFFLGV
jgi:hypothetical protein